MMIEVERMAPDGLTREVWQFYAYVDGYTTASPLKLRLDRWEPQQRRTTRHKWTRQLRVGDDVAPREAWHFRHHNGHRHEYGWRLPAAEVPCPADVMAEAHDKLIDRLIIVAGPVDPL